MSTVASASIDHTTRPGAGGPAPSVAKTIRAAAAGAAWVVLVAITAFGARQTAQAGDGGTGSPPRLLLAQAESQEDWTTHRLAGFTLATPPGWTVTVRDAGNDFTAASPQGDRTLMVWWWFPDEPLLGYADIVSHRKVTVAGRPALRIHSKFPQRESLSVTFDKARADGKRLQLLFEANAPLARGDADFEAMLARLQFGAAAPAPKSEAPRLPPAQATSAKLPAAASRYLPGPNDGEQARVGLGPVSFEPPFGWQVQPDRTGRLIAMVRPDSRAEILVVLWPEERAMPNEGIERIEHTMVVDEPVTRLRLRSGRMEIDHLFFEEPFADGSRLSVLYRASGEAVEDGTPLFELVLASLSRRLPAPAGGADPFPVGLAAAGDPFADLDMSELEMPLREPQ
jgi:hypothetical protein